MNHITADYQEEKPKYSGLCEVLTKSAMKPQTVEAGHMAIEGQIWYFQRVKLPQ